MLVEKLLLALGLVLAVEGAMYALFPTFLRRMVRQVDMVSDVQLRRGGLIAMLSGVAPVWLMN